MAGSLREDGPAFAEPPLHKATAKPGATAWLGAPKKGGGPSALGLFSAARRGNLARGRTRLRRAAFVRQLPDYGEPGPTA